MSTFFLNNRPVMKNPFTGPLADAGSDTMKTIKTVPFRGTPWGARLVPFLGAVLLAVGFARAQGFDVGSNGSGGDVVISTNTTMDLPPDGRIHVRSLTVNSGVTLQFRKNTNNTPVVILAQSSIVVDGTISVNGFDRSNLAGGEGGPGGFGGGNPGFGPEFPPGHGYGPGGGLAGVNSCSSGDGIASGGSFGTRGFSSPSGVYGDALLLSLVGGSGGGGAGGTLEGGGGGGGAILLAANQRITIRGTVQALGGFGGACNNAGSGGAIRLVSFRVEGTGVLDCRAGATPNRGLGNTDTGFGRIRIDTLERSGLTFSAIRGVFVAGSNLISLPPAVPSLAVIKAAGKDVPQDSGTVTFILPFDSDPAQTIKVRASGFGRVVPILVTLTPDSGSPIRITSQIDNTAPTPAEVEVPVTLPTNTRVTVHVWTE